MKFTFKKEKKETGLGSVGYPNANTEIKESKKIVGYIYAPNWQSKDNLWGVQISVWKAPSKEKPAPFKWIAIKQAFLNETQARMWVKENLAKLVKERNFTLYHFED